MSSHELAYRLPGRFGRHRKRISTRFDPDDPVSIQSAIDHVEHAIDAKIARFRGNRLVEEAADQIKAECRANILQQVEFASTERGTRTLR